MTTSPANQYQKDALRTKSDAFFGANYSRNVLTNYLGFVSDYNEQLDHIKKGMFYGRNLGEHTPVLPKAASVETNDRKLIDLIHAIVGVNTEGGELAQRLLTVINRRNELPLFEENTTSILTKDDTVNLFEELGDVLWYVAIAAEALDVTIDQIMTANINKLKKRFPEKFTQEKANVRDIEIEQKTLEKDLTAWDNGGKVEPSKQTTKRASK